MGKGNPIEVVGAVIAEDGRCLVARRGPGMSLAGKWEFPGGKVEPGELQVDALRREIEEELGLLIRVDTSLGSATVEIKGVLVRLEIFLSSVEAGELVLVEHDRVSWFRADALGSLDWAPCDIPLIGKVVEALDRESTREARTT